VAFAHEAGLAAEDGNRPLMTGLRAKAATIALFFIDPNDGPDTFPHSASPPVLNYFGIKIPVFLFIVKAFCVDPVFPP
jgi:hypothetical protein